MSLLPGGTGADGIEKGGGSGEGVVWSYATAAELYVAAGWQNPVPIGVGRRDSPPSGFTGKSGKHVTPDDLAGWVAHRGGDNLGVRLPQHAVGIDVDNHDGKRGVDQLKVLLGKHGSLPPTFYSTSRDDGSAIFFYQAPVPVAAALKDLAPDIELIRHWYRYAAVWPTISEKTEKVYRWYDPEGEVLPEGSVPAVSDLPDLPESWYTVKPIGGAEGGSGDWSGGDSWTNPDVDELLRSGIPAGAPQDPALRDLVWKLVSAGHSDEQVKLQWLAVVAQTPLLKPGEPWTAEDFRRHLSGAREKLGAGVQVPAAFVAGLTAGSGGRSPASTAPKMTLSPPTTPMPVARELVPEWRHENSGMPTRWSWRGSWLTWTGTHWMEEEDGLFQDWLYRRLERVVWLKVTDDEDEKLVPWNPTKRTTGEVERAAQSLRRLDAETEMGAWWSREERCWVAPVAGAARVACRNGVVETLTGELVPHAPNWLNASAVPFDYDPSADCGRWLAFLEEVFPKDPASAVLLQEWFGYVVSGRLDQQKMMMLIGASRAGKSTVAGVLTKLVGTATVAAPTLSSFGTNFGLSSLIGKQLAVVDDARYSSKIDMQVVIERLLTITGGGRLDVDRKNRSIWSGRLPTRVMISSNELPWFQDASAAIVNRMLVLHFKESFLGREDVELEQRLELELPGILNWALEGLRRLTLMERFSPVESAVELVDDMREQASPITAFIEDRCDVGGERAVASDELYDAWVWWLALRGSTEKMTSAVFGRRLRSALPKVEKRRGPTGADGKRPWVYHGVQLKVSVDA